MNVAKLELILDENSRLITEKGKSLKISDLEEGTFYKGLDFSISSEEVNTFPTEFYLSKKELVKKEELDLGLKSNSYLFVDIYNKVTQNPIIFLGVEKEDKTLVYPIVRENNVYIVKDQITPNIGRTASFDTVYLSENGKSLREGFLLFNYILNENITSNAIINSVGNLYKLTFKYYIPSIGTIPTLTILGYDQKAGLNLNYL